jgi:hypothetical protein
MIDRAFFFDGRPEKVKPGGARNRIPAEIAARAATR